MAEAASKHKHWFTAIPTRLGPYGPQDVHLHNCIEGEPGDCDDAIVGPGKDCGGKSAPHEHMTLTEDGLQPAETLARLRAAVPVAAIPEQQDLAAAASAAIEAAMATPQQQDFRRTLRETAFDLPPHFGPVPERIKVSYCTDYCGAACTCPLAGSHVIYCRGCGKAWLEPPDPRPLADPPVDQPSFCACTCRDGDPHYEDWVTDPWVCACGMIAPKGEFRVFPHDDCDGGRVLTLGELQTRGSRG